MIVYRFEHIGCVGSEYTLPNPNHGPGMGDCHNAPHLKPSFGTSLNPPNSIRPHERCAVTVEQYPLWWGTDWDNHRVEPREYHGWAVMAYQLNDDAEGTDWRYDGDQIVFDTYAADRLGRVPATDIMDHSQLREIRLRQDA